MLACSWMLVQAGREMFSTIGGAFSAEQLAWPVAIRELLFLVLITAGFLARLIALSNIRKVRYGSVAASGVFATTLAWLYFLESFPALGNGAIYNLLDPDRLGSWCLVFVFFSSVRFTLTAALALVTKSHEVGTYS